MRKISKKRIFHAIIKTGVCHGKKSVNANEKSPKLTVPEVISYCKNTQSNTVQPAQNRQRAENTSALILGIWLSFLL